MFRVRVSTLSAVAVLLACIRPASGETVNCTAITSIGTGYTISTGGVYCLTADLSTTQTSGNAITINANHVLLDMNGFKLGGPSNTAGTGHGIHVNAGIFEVVIRNGKVRNFEYGIYVAD